MMVIKKMLTRRIAEIKRLIVFVMGVRSLTATRMATMRTAWPARRSVVFMAITVILQLIVCCRPSSSWQLYTSIMMRDRCG